MHINITRPSLARCRADVELWDAIMAQSKVTFVDTDAFDGVSHGTLRGGTWTQTGDFADADVDRRDAYVRITMKSGVERWIAWKVLADLRERHELMFDW